MQNELLDKHCLRKHGPMPITGSNPITPGFIAPALRIDMFFCNNAASTLLALNQCVCENLPEIANVIKPAQRIASVSDRASLINSFSRPLAMNCFG